MDFSNRIISARKAKGLSQEALADMIGVSRQAISKWETGEAKPDVDKLIVLSAALDLSLDYLCLGIEPAVQKAPTVSPTPEVKKADPSLKNIQRLLITLLAALALIVFCFICFQIQRNNPVHFPQTGNIATPQSVLNNYTIQNVRIGKQGNDATPSIIASVVYIQNDMEIQLILEYENFPDMAPVILKPEIESGQLFAPIPRECYHYSFRVRALLTLANAQRSIPLMSGLKVDESGWIFTPVTTP